MKIMKLLILLLPSLMYGIPQALIDNCGWYYSNCPDFHACSIVYGGYATGFATEARYGWTIEKYESSKWVEKVDNTEHTWPGPVHGTWVGYDNLYYVGASIAQYGNGQYRLKCWVESETYPTVVTDNTSWIYCTVNDVISPDTPTSFSGSWSNNHPYLNWTSNSEDDFKEYVIYKKVGSGSWNSLTTTSSSHFTDNSENKWSLGDESKRYVYYRISAKDYTNNESSVTSSVSFVCSPHINKESISSDEQIATTFKLDQNFPNPFNPSTQIRYSLNKDGYVSLTIYSVVGEKISELVNEFQSRGFYNVKFDASDLPSGIYIYKLQAGEFSSTKKMILTK